MRYVLGGSMKQDNSVIGSEKYVIDLTKPWHVAWWAKQFGRFRKVVR